MNVARVPSFNFQVVLVISEIPALSDLIRAAERVIQSHPGLTDTDLKTAILQWVFISWKKSQILDDCLQTDIGHLICCSAD